ncbi:MAG: lysine--tRNA ligase [Phycisphaerales bacterium]|nr:lysine--tRNA ligase [Phycisphaerales bacterium]
MSKTPNPTQPAANTPISATDSASGEGAPAPIPTHVLEQQRRTNRDEVRKLGMNPYGSRTENLLTLADARAKYDEEASTEYNAKGKEPGYQDRRPRVTVAGRIMLLRDNGKLLWINLRDATGDLQVAISQKDCAEAGFKLAKLTDLADIIVVSGRVMKTKTGEVTVWADDVKPGTKSLVQPPEKHAGLSDVEIRYRQRYTDLWANPETMQVFAMRSKIVGQLRRFLESRGYLEVETPMLQSLAGGAAARPFVTKMNALDINLFMRIAPELYLKRLLVGGMPKVFEINRNFRNEGLDKQHNPEFTMLEAYHAFGDVETVMELTESAIRDAATMVHRAAGGGGGSGDVILPFGELQINYTKPFERVSYGQLFEKAYGYAMTETERTRKDLATRMPQHAGAIGSMDPWLVVNELFEMKGEDQLDHSRPTFITDYPSAISPLTRPKPSNPALSDRADLFIAGMEVAPHYTELNDPDIQEERFKEQLKGLDAEKNTEENTFRTMDHDFLRALKVGMPPAGGMGLGVDRLVMILTNQRTIRDVMLFPLMRPEA